MLRIPVLRKNPDPPNCFKPYTPESLLPSPPTPPPPPSRARGSLALPPTVPREIRMQSPCAVCTGGCPRALTRGPLRPLPRACSRRRPPIRPPHLELRRRARGAHGAEGGGPGAPHASSRPGPPERRSGQHAGSCWRRRSSQGRGNGAAARAQRGQREPARATARHRSVPSGGVSIRTPGFALSSLRVPCSGTFRSKFRVLGFVDPDSGIS